MKTLQLVKLTLTILVISLLVAINVYAQDKKDNDCCKSSGTKTEKMDHTKMNCPQTDSTNTSQLTAKEVDSNLVAWNELCPVKGNKIDPEANKVEYNGKIYGFCCNGCDGKFLKDPEKYSKNLSEDGKSFLGTK